MSSSFTYSTLSTAIKNHCEDQGSDFNNNLNTLIKFAEDWCIRALQLEIFKTTATITVTQGTRTITKPTGYLTADTLFLASATIAFLERRTYEYCQDYATVIATEGTPKFFAELNETQLYIVPTPNAAAAVAGITARYLKRPDSLVTDTAGTWLSENVGDLLFHACMVAADKFNIADERVAALWVPERDRLALLAREDFKDLISRDDSPLAAQPKAKPKAQEEA